MDARAQIRQLAHCKSKMYGNNGTIKFKFVFL